MDQLQDIQFGRKNYKVRTVVKSIEKESQDGWTLNEYHISKCIGRGSFAEVFRATKSVFGKQKEFAIKKIRKKGANNFKRFGRKNQEQVGTQLAMKEIAIMKKLNHNNLIRLHEVILNPDDEYLYLVLELCQNGQLIQWDGGRARFVKLLDVKLDRRRLVRDTVKGLHYLFINGIFHRDIKPQNILFSQEGVAKFGDFGISFFGNSQSKKDQFLTDIKGTEAFYPPEYIHAMRNDKPFRIAGRPVDIWALGITFYSFAYLVHPFFNEGDNTQSMYDNIINMPLRFPESEQQQQDQGGFKQLLGRMLTKSPTERITVQEIIYNNWVNEGCQPLVREIKEQIVKVNQTQVQDSYSVYSLQLAHKFLKNMRQKTWHSLEKDKKSEEPQADHPIKPSLSGVLNRKMAQRDKQQEQPPQRERLRRRSRVQSSYGKVFVEFFNARPPKNFDLGQKAIVLNGIQYTVQVSFKSNMFNSYKVKIKRGQTQVGCLYVREESVKKDGEELLQRIAKLLRLKNDKEFSLQGIQYFILKRES